MWKEHKKINKYYTEYVYKWAFEIHISLHTV